MTELSGGGGGGLRMLQSGGVSLLGGSIFQEGHNPGGHYALYLIFYNKSTFCDSFTLFIKSLDISVEISGVS